jgi:DNA-binding NtrC family response regulator
VPLARCPGIMRSTPEIVVASFKFLEITAKRVIDTPKGQMSITDVLVVDDDGAICQIVRRMLSDEHCKVQTRQSVADAFSAIDQKAFDAYVIDFKLPDGSGLDVAERIRSKWGTSPIILMSGYDPAAVALRAEKLNISNFLEKPFSREIICEAVKNAIGVQKAAPKLAPVDPPTSTTASGGRSRTRFWQRPAKRPAS